MAAPSHPVAYDFTRLASRIFSRTPNGIDRVDLAYAWEFLGQGGQADCGMLYLGPLGIRCVSREAAWRAVRGIDAHYGEAAENADEALLRAVAEWLGGGGGAVPGPGATELVPGTRWRARAAYTLRTLASAGRCAAAALPEGARYVCVSQFPLSEPGAYEWLRQRPDVKAVFFIHDLLPLQYPEYFRAPEQARHRRRLAQLARAGAAALVSTRSVADVLRHELGLLGRADFPIHVSPVPLAPGFSPVPPVPALAQGGGYFIQCGTIEPRKNHLTILHAWREMSAVMGRDTPKLVLVGAPGWENENVLDLLDRSPAIRRNVLLLRDIKTPTLVALMRGARAVLMPSFAEGFGLPVAEAMALGVPVIASDIPVFHEITGGRFRAVHPLDGPGWIAAIRSASAGEIVRTPPAARNCAESFGALRQFIDGL